MACGSWKRLALLLTVAGLSGCGGGSGDQPKQTNPDKLASCLRNVFGQVSTAQKDLDVVSSRAGVGGVRVLTTQQEIDISVERSHSDAEETADTYRKFATFGDTRVYGNVTVAYNKTPLEIEKKAIETCVDGRRPPTAKRRVPPANGIPVAVSLQELHSLAAAVGNPVYWVGEEARHNLELTRNKRGEIYIRYLPEGVEIGDERPRFLTIGTYRDPDPYGLQKHRSRHRDATSVRIAHGGIAVTSKELPHSYYVAYPHGRVLIEVFDPSSRRARKFATSGLLVPFGGRKQESSPIPHAVT